MSYTKKEMAKLLTIFKKMDTKILKSFQTRFAYPPTNWGQVIYLWKNNLPITFYSWECPPRRIDYDKKYGRWVNFDVDIKKIVNGGRTDKYTEIPRIISKTNEEKWFIKNIINQNPNAKYIKLIADTNGLYLFPKSKIILGRSKINLLSEIFLNELRTKSKNLFGNLSPKFYLYTYFQNKYREKYEMYFNSILTSLTNKQNVIPIKSLEAWEDCMINHDGFDKENEIDEQRDVMNRIIASYCAEGMIFELLSKNNIIPNPVWINWEEKPETAVTTQILREKNSLQPLPIIYLN